MVNVPSTSKKRVDAAGRDLVQSMTENAEFANPQPKAKPQKAPEAPAQPVRRQEFAGGPVMPDTLGLSGGGSQNLGDVSKDDAQARFNAVLAKAPVPLRTLPGLGP